MKTRILIVLFTTFSLYLTAEENYISCQQTSNFKIECETDLAVIDGWEVDGIRSSSEEKLEYSFGEEGTYEITLFYYYSDQKQYRTSQSITIRTQNMTQQKKHTPIRLENIKTSHGTKVDDYGYLIFDNLAKRKDLKIKINKPNATVILKMDKDDDSFYERNYRQYYLERKAQNGIVIFKDIPQTPLIIYSRDNDFFGFTYIKDKDLTESNLELKHIGNYLDKAPEEKPEKKLAWAKDTVRTKQNIAPSSFSFPNNQKDHILSQLVYLDNEETKFEAHVINNNQSSHLRYAILDLDSADYSFEAFPYHDSRGNKTIFHLNHHRITPNNYSVLAIAFVDHYYTPRQQRERERAQKNNTALKKMSETRLQHKALFDSFNAPFVPKNKKEIPLPFNLLDLSYARGICISKGGFKESTRKEKRSNLISDYHFELYPSNTSCELEKRYFKCAPHDLFYLIMPDDEKMNTLILNKEYTFSKKNKMISYALLEEKNHYKLLSSYSQFITWSAPSGKEDTNKIRIECTFKKDIPISDESIQHQISKRNDWQEKYIINNKAIPNKDTAIKKLKFLNATIDSKIPSTAPEKKIAIPLSHIENKGCKSQASILNVEEVLGANSSIKKIIIKDYNKEMKLDLNGLNLQLSYPDGDEYFSGDIRFEMIIQEALNQEFNQLQEESFNNKKRSSEYDAENIRLKELRQRLKSAKNFKDHRKLRNDFYSNSKITLEKKYSIAKGKYAFFLRKTPADNYMISLYTKSSSRPILDRKNNTVKTTTTTLYFNCELRESSK